LRLTIYSKPGCHLCDEMKSLVHRVISRQSSDEAVSVDEIDISSDRTLVDRYGLEIPVLLVDGKKVAKYRVSEEELTRMLEARTGKGEGVRGKG
jgi:glutaredoxin